MQLIQARGMGLFLDRFGPGDGVDEDDDADAGDDNDDDDGDGVVVLLFSTRGLIVCAISTATSAAVGEVKSPRSTNESGEITTSGRSRAGLSFSSARERPGGDKLCEEERMLFDTDETSDG